MCVIMLVDKARPTENMVDKAWTRNDDGGGVAWREGNEVVWKKGIEDVEEMQDLIKTLPLPFIAHFRVASCGGVRPSLTHPFLIDKNAPLALGGRTKGYVLFHNGDWKEWSETTRAAAIASNTPVPVGRWSDTRAIAWLCSIYGPGFMELLPTQRGVAFGPKDMEIFTGPGWIKVNDVWCSNDIFMTTKFVQVYGQGHNSKYCRYGTCVRQDIDGHNYCPDHRGGVPQYLHEKKAESGGAQAGIPFGPIIQLEEAERLHKREDHHGNKLLSKNQLKRIRRLYSDLAGNDVKKKISARLELEKVSRSLTTNGRAN